MRLHGCSLSAISGRHDLTANSPFLWLLTTSLPPPSKWPRVLGAGVVLQMYQLGLCSSTLHFDWFVVFWNGLCLPPTLLSFRIVYHHNRIVTRWGKSNIDSGPKYLDYSELLGMGKLSLYESQFGGKWSWEAGSLCVLMVLEECRVPRDLMIWEEIQSRSQDSWFIWIKLNELKLRSFYVFLFNCLCCGSCGCVFEIEPLTLVGPLQFG